MPICRSHLTGARVDCRLQTLYRKTNIIKSMMSSAHNRFGRLSPLTDGPDLRQQHRPGPGPGPGAPFGSPLTSAFVEHGHLLVASQAGQSFMSLTIFAGCIMALIMYTILKMLTVRFGGARQPRAGSSVGPANRREDKSHMGRARRVTDLRQDKRKLAKLSREERTRQLILHHGGKNVARAMRFLIGELESQKQQLIAESGRPTGWSSPSSGDANPVERAEACCSCSCHHQNAEQTAQSEHSHAMAGKASAAGSTDGLRTLEGSQHDEDPRVGARLAYD